VNFNPRSLTVRIALVVLAVSLLSVALVAVFSGWTTAREYDRLIMEQLQTNFATQAANYHSAQGSWAGFDEAILRTLPPNEHRSFRRGDYYRGQEQALFPFVLLDADGCVVGPNTDAYPVGTCLSGRQLNGGVPVEVDGRQAGTVIETGTVVIRNPSEDLFLARTTRGLVLGAIGASMAALLLGIGLAATLTRPLRRLTTAIHAMAAGQLEQRVEVRSHDEIGELAGAFNDMSSELVRANQARRQMTADIAHELRNPLMVITGYIEALRDGVLKPSPQRFEMMHEEAQRLQRMVADLRTLSLADAGELTLQRQPAAPEPLLARVAELYTPVAEQQQVRIVTQVEGDPPDVAIDVERMAQVLSNLVTNALRHTPAGGEVRLGAHVVDNAVALTVADSGEGIPAEALPHIFDRFYRADGARTQNGDESGLGLAIVKSIVAAHGGTITVESELGQGSRFEIRLPRSDRWQVAGGR
jgi:signal transduction histidine kinase